jgi:type IX secretion system PorP/SprF family membrane protein
LENNFNIGLSILQDKSFFGLLRKNSFTISASYQKTISKEKTSLGVGFSTSFIQRRIDISNLSFQNQFTSFGFDVNNIPSGEALISNAKSYQSFATGILLSCRSIGSKRFFKLGISAFNINKPKETFQDDESSFVPLRKVLHYSYQNYRPSGKIETFGIFQNQTGVNEFTLGLISDYFFNKNNRPQTAILQNSFGLGLIYRHKDALSPIIRTEIKNATFMLSYDITTSKLNNSMRGSQSFEATLQYRIKKN